MKLSLSGFVTLWSIEMKKPASVHIDIAEFSMIVMEIPATERGEWLLSFAKCLALGKPELNSYGATLLAEAIEFSNEISKKRTEAANARWHKKPDATVCKPMQTHAPALGCNANDAVQTEQSRQKVLKTYTPEFEEFWKAYCRPKDKGSKPEAFKEWQKLTESERLKAIQGIIPYKDSQSSPEYMKHSERYLKHKVWEGTVSESSSFEEYWDDATGKIKQRAVV